MPQPCHLSVPLGRAMVTSGLGSSHSWDEPSCSHSNCSHSWGSISIPKAGIPGCGKAEDPHSLGTEEPQRLPGPSHLGMLRTPLSGAPTPPLGAQLVSAYRQTILQRKKIILVNIYLSALYSMYLNWLTVFSNRVCQQMDSLVCKILQF